MISGQLHFGEWKESQSSTNRERRLRHTLTLVKVRGGQVSSCFGVKYQRLASSTSICVEALWWEWLVRRCSLLIPDDSEHYLDGIVSTSLVTRKRHSVTTLILGIAFPCALQSCLGRFGDVIARNSCYINSFYTRDGNLQSNMLPSAGTSMKGSQNIQTQLATMTAINV